MLSRNKREGHYWCWCGATGTSEKSMFMRFPKAARYKYKKQKTISKCIMHNPEHKESQNGKT